MTEDEFRRVLAEPAREPQVFLLDARDPRRIVFCILVRFPNNRIIRVLDENIPSSRHHIDPMRCSYYAGVVRNQLMKNQRQGDADNVNFTNWPSLAAAIQGQIFTFNKHQEARAARENPMRSAVRGALNAAKPVRPVYFRRREPVEDVKVSDTVSQAIQDAAAILDAQPVPTEGRMIYDPTDGIVKPVESGGGGDFAGGGGGGSFDDRGVETGAPAAPPPAPDTSTPSDS